MNDFEYTIELKRIKSETKRNSLLNTMRNNMALANRSLRLHSSEDTVYLSSSNTLETLESKSKLLHLANTARNRWAELGGRYYKTS